MKTQKETEQEIEQKTLYQFISSETGNRSEPFIADWDTIDEIIQGRTEEKPQPLDKDFILLVALIAGEHTTIPKTPIITVEHFRQFREDQQSLQHEAQS